MTDTNSPAPEPRGDTPTHIIGMTPDQLRAIIAQTGLSNSDAARQLGVNPRQMRAWLSGKTAISRGRADHITCVLTENAAWPEYVIGAGSDGRRYIVRLVAPRLILALDQSRDGQEQEAAWLDKQPVDAARWIDAARAYADTR